MNDLNDDCSNANMKKNIILGFPLYLFPIFLILAILVNYNLKLSNLIQFIIGFYFIFTLPLYPIFIFPGITTLQKNNLISSRIGLLFCSNLSLFIILGFFLKIMNIELTNTLLIVYPISIFLICLFLSIFYRSKEYSQKINLEFLKEIILRNKINNLFPSNFGLLMLFLIIAGILIVVRFPILFGDDPWFHSFNTANVASTGYINITGAYSSLYGLYVIGASFQIISGLEVLFVAHWFPLITIFIGGILGYNITSKIFKKEQLAILGGIIFIVTPLDSALAFGQYWPTAISLLLILSIFIILLYSMDNKINLIFNLILNLILSVSAFITHDTTAIILEFLMAGVFIIEFLRDSKFLILAIISVLNIIIPLFLRGILENAVLSDNLAKIVDFPPIIFLGLSIVLGIGIFVLKRFDIVNLIFKGVEKPFRITKNPSLFRKTSISIIFFVGLFICMFIYNILPEEFGYNQIPELVMSIDSFYIFIICVFSVGGILTLRRWNIKTDILFFYIILILIIFIGFFGLYQFLNYPSTLWTRVTIIGGGILSIGSIAYIFLLIKRNILTLNKQKLLIIFIFSLIANFGYYQVSNYWYKTDSEVNSVKTISDAIDQDDSSIISGFRWSYIYWFYTNKSISQTQRNEDNYYALVFSYNHNNRSNNRLEDLKKETKHNNTYIMIEYKQATIGVTGMEEKLYGYINRTEIDIYHKLPYVNKIFSMKSSQNKYNYLFWIIY